MENWWLERKILDLSYIPASSEKYTKIKGDVYNLLNNENYIYYKYFARFIIFLVVASTVAHIYNIRAERPLWLEAIEFITIFIFAIEYIARFWVANDIHWDYISAYEEATELNQNFSLSRFFLQALQKKLYFMISPINVIDLLSIHPMFVSLRLLKLIRYFSNAKDLISVFQDKKYEVTLLSVTIFFIVLISASMFYKFEANNQKVTTFMDAIYWSIITIGTVGYGDISPETLYGRLTSIVLVFLGISFIAMFTSIITTGLDKKLEETKEKNSYKVLDKLKDYILIIGYGKIGRDIAIKLKKSNENFIIVDKNSSKVDSAKKDGYLAFPLDATLMATFQVLKLNEKVKDILVLTGSDLTNISIILTIRAINRNIFIGAGVNDILNKEKYTLVGVNEAVDQKIGAQVLAQFVNSPIAFQAISELFYDSEKITIHEILIYKVESEKGHIDYNDIDIESFDLMAIGIYKYSDGPVDNFLFNPSPKEIILKEKDILIVAGRPKNIEGLKLKIVKASAN